MLRLVDATSPLVRMIVGHVTLRTIILIEVECLGGVVHVYSPVSSSDASNILSLGKTPKKWLTMFSYIYLYSNVESLITPWAQPWGYSSLVVLLVDQTGVPNLLRKRHSI